MIQRHLRFHILGVGLAVLLAAGLPSVLSVPVLRAQLPAGTAPRTKPLGPTSAHPKDWRVRGGAGEIPTASGDGGEHVRLISPRGAIHVWRPGAYDARTAGIVVYVHGYFSNVDQAWEDDHLAEQFQASGRNALFIAPEAPEWPGEGVRWRDLGTLFSEVRQGWNERLPAGPMVLVGHSAAYRTIVNWLREPRVKSVILLDGLYRDERQFRRWLRYAPGHESHRLVLVADETARQSQRLARRFPQACRLGRIPDDLGDFTVQERRARLLVLRSQYAHMEIVSSGRVIPLLLGLPPLSSLATTSQAAGSD